MITEETKNTFWNTLLSSISQTFKKVLLLESKASIAPGLSSFLYMLTVNGVGGADPGVILRWQVKIFETLQKKI